jgi:hypothetical protein
MAAAGALGLAPAARAFAAGDLASAAREAWLYGLPLIEVARTRARALAAGAAINTFHHGRSLAGPQNRGVTSPNNDTIYSSAWLDLTRGPATLVVPPTGGRYISLQFMNMFTVNDVVLGTRTTGGDGGRYAIVGPGQTGSGPGVVRLSTPHGWLLVRMLVDGPDDLPAAHRIQDGLKLAGPTAPSPPAYAARTAPAGDYFASVDALLRSDPPPATDGAFFARTAALGLGPRGPFDARRFAPAQMAEIEAGVAEAHRDLRAAGGALSVSVDGWRYPPADLGVYGQDYGLRAAVALGGLAALPRHEAMYMNPVADRGRMFLGEGPYRLTFAPGRTPPVDAFWSLTMYQATAEGQFFLVENSARRYSIGDRTRGLAKNPDGSLDIWIARNDPGGARSANWLPAPASGPFTLSMRCYLPRRELLDGRYRLPPVLPA